MKKIVFLVFVFICFMGTCDALSIYSKNAVLYNLNDNEIVFKKKENERISIASLTKIMTNLVAISNVESLDDTVTITDEMLDGLVEDDAYVVGLKVGQVVTYRDLIHASLLESGADASNALAIGISGSVSDFVLLMNEKALELGLKQTKFANPIGLDDKNNYSSVNDMANLLMYAYNNDIFKNIFNKKSYIFSDKSMTVHSGMYYMAKAEKIDTSFFVGGKTGFTDDALRCLASIAYDKDNDIYYLLVTAGAKDSYTHFYHILDAYNIYKYYFNNYSYHSLIKKDELLVSVNDRVSHKKINIYAKENVLYYDNKSFDDSHIKMEYVGKKEVSVFDMNDKIGYIDIYYDDLKIKSIDVILDGVNFFEKDLFSIISGLFLLISIIIFCLSIKKLRKVSLH